MEGQEFRIKTETSSAGKGKRKIDDILETDVGELESVPASADAQVVKTESSEFGQPTDSINTDGNASATVKTEPAESGKLATSINTEESASVTEREAKRPRIDNVDGLTVQTSPKAFLPPSSFVFSNPDGHTGEMFRLRPHPIRAAIEAKARREATSKVYREKLAAMAQVQDSRDSSISLDAAETGTPKNGDDGGESEGEWTYYLREKDVGITAYLSEGLGGMEGIIKQRFTDFMVYEINLAGEIIHLKNIDCPVEPNLDADSGSSSRGALSTPKTVGGASEEDLMNGEANTDKTAASTASPELPEELRFEPKPEWNGETTSQLIPLLPTTSIKALHDLFLEGQTPPQTSATAANEEEAENEAAVDGAVAGWAAARARGRGRGRGQGRDRGKGRGSNVWGAGHSDDPREIVSELITDKAARTAFHATIRKVFNGMFETFTKQFPNEEGSRVAIKWSNKRRSNIHNTKLTEDGALKQSNRLPGFIHFTLQKANRDSQDCLTHLARLTRLPSNAFMTCGTKDKRGVTVQRVCLKRGRTTMKQFWEAANGITEGLRTYKEAITQRGDRGFRVGDIEYSSQFLELGMLKGNHFTITLRNVKAESEQAVDAILASLRSRGFINYYGMQRFGTASVTSQTIGMLMLRSQWKEAADLLLSHRPGEHPDGVAARRAWAERRDAKEALRLMPRRNVAERSMWEFFDRPDADKDDALGALLNIPRNLRLLYIHSYQSYVWNVIASERIKMNPNSPIVGDVVFADKTEKDEDAPKKKPAVKILTEEDLHNYTLADVVIPLPGHEISLPQGPLFDTVKAIMSMDGLDPENMKREQKEFSLGGSYRKLVHVPGDLTWKHLRYDDPDVPLAVSDEDILLGQAELPPTDKGQFWAVQISLTLGTSAYATMALRELTKVETSAYHQTQLTAKSEDQVQKNVVDVEAA